jgi:hypothetical protein
LWAFSHGKLDAKQLSKSAAAGVLERRILMTGIYKDIYTGMSRQHIHTLASHVVLFVASLILLALYDLRFAAYVVAAVAMTLFITVLPLGIVACALALFVRRKRLQEAAQRRSDWES